MRMVSNCIECDASFFKMIKGAGGDMSELAESLYITDELYSDWQNESKQVGVHDSVINAIKNIRKILAALEKRTAISFDIIYLTVAGAKRTE